MTSATDLERRLRARYRQPAGVEQFGIEPVPEERKTAGWFDLFSIMFNFLINPGIMLSGGLMVAAGCRSRPRWQPDFLAPSLRSSSI